MQDEEICIVHQGLERMPAIGKLCKRAIFRRNRISKIELRSCEVLEELDLYDNAIVGIENLEAAPNLKMLDLSFNLIRKNTLPRLENLMELYLIGNDINFIEKMDLPSLVKLDMAANNLEKMENLEGLGSLKELYLGSNGITEVNNIRHLSNLRVLDLQNNRLIEVDCAELPSSLQTLLLNENYNLKDIKNLPLLPNLEFIAIAKTSVVAEAISIYSKVEIWR
jgi:Leucine-rich repeat (LRR) protein